MAKHFHPTLRIVIRGTDVPVAPNIGVDPATGAMSAVHTHEGDGTIHVEATTENEVFTLGQVFVQWGMPLSHNRVGNVTTKTEEKVSVTDNGSPVGGNPTKVVLRPDQRLVVTLG